MTRLASRWLYLFLSFVNCVYAIWGFSCCCCIVIDLRSTTNLDSFHLYKAYCLYDSREFLDLLHLHSRKQHGFRVLDRSFRLHLHFPVAQFAPSTLTFTSLSRFRHRHSFLPLYSVHPFSFLPPRRPYACLAAALSQGHLLRLDNDSHLLPRSLLTIIGEGHR
jgi:hypothetical protein